MKNAAQQFIHTRGEVWDIGQLDSESMRWLRSQVKSGAIVKTKELWCGLVPKSVYRPCRQKQAEAAQ